MSFLTRKKDKEKDIDIDNTKCYNILIAIDKVVNDDISRSVINFANFCANNSIKAVVLCGYIDINIKTICDEKVEIVINKDILSFSEKGYFKLDSSIINSMYNICKSYKIDVINVCYVKFAPIAKEVALKCDIPYISTVYTIFDVKSKIDYLYSKIVAESHMIIVTSEYIEHFLLNNYNFDRKKIKIFPAITDKKIFDISSVSEKRIRSVLSDIDVNIGNKKIILCFCNYNDISMYIKLINIVMEIKNNNDFVIVFTGIFNRTKKNRTLLLKRIKETNTESRIRVVDAVIDRPAIYALSYAVIYLDDNVFSNVHYEAMLMRRPVISTDSYLYSMNVIEKKNGFLVKTSSITDIKNAILTMLNLNTDEYLKMCKSAYKYASSYFYKEEIAQKMIEDIHSLIMNYGNKKDNIDDNN